MNITAEQESINEMEQALLTEFYADTPTAEQESMAEMQQALLEEELGNLDEFSFGDRDFHSDGDQDLSRADIDLQAFGFVAKKEDAYAKYIEEHGDDLPF